MNLHVPSWNRRVVVVKILPVTLLLQLQDFPQLARIVLIGDGTCLKVGGGGGATKIVTEMHVQTREGSDCNYSQYCLMFLFN